ncbi:MAG: hypothetical protein C0507_25080 [Cyanobacteria bacterium PR.3.49]|nr:hypothetical protein [Cyanobacteria bacterium PR.3.49]
MDSLAISFQKTNLDLLVPQMQRIDKASNRNHLIVAPVQCFDIGFLKHPDLIDKRDHLKV